MNLPRYPKYKASGVEWLGDVPDGWKVVPCRNIVQEQTAKNDDSKCQDYLSLMANVGVLPYAEKGDVGNKKPEDLSKCKIVSRGDFVINSMNYGIGSYGLSNYDGICSPVYIVLKPKNDIVESRFAFRIFECRSFQRFAQSFGNGILEHRSAINWDILKSIGVGLPCLQEQKQILEFLDRETGKIDELVAEQRRLMELLKEKRQAVISHAVTKGLNPHAPMKPSGIEWLGAVPAGWTVKRFQRCVYVAEGQVDPSDGKFADMALIAPNHIESGTGRLLGLETSADQGADSGKYMCKTGDVVYSKIRPALRKVCIAPEDCLCSADMYPLRPHSGLTPRFLFWLILSEQFSALAELESQRVAMPKINRESLKAVMIAVPPVAEQNTINAFLESEATKFDTLTAEAQRTIDLLQERRTALISAAVTGQIDVRNSLRN